MCINQHTKLKMPGFANSKDMIGAKLKKGHVTLITPFKGGLSSKSYYLIQSVCKI